MCGLRLVTIVVVLAVVFPTVSRGQGKRLVDDALPRLFALTDAKYRSSRRNLNTILQEQPGFWREIHGVAARLKTHPAWLLNVMACESLFDADARNPLPGQSASGLLQIIESTARGMGTTANAIRQMSPLQQLRFVERYFKPFTGQLDTLADVYTAVLRGSVIEGGDAVIVVNSKNEQRVYTLNKSLDLNNDGYITKGELGLVALSIGRFMPAAKEPTKMALAYNEGLTLVYHDKNLSDQSLFSENRNVDIPRRTRSTFIRGKAQD
jgi:transglycosylase-like protein with SLT domain